VYKKAQPAHYSPPRRVLIVEDDIMSRDILSKIIANYFGCEVNIAGSAREACSYLNVRDYDLVIAGYSDSDAIPLTAIEKIKNQINNTPIIVVVGDCPDEHQGNIRKQGIDRVVYKPLRLTPFLELVAGAFLEKEHALNFA
jgi:CheY-like chemotaxis protein